MGKKNKSLIVLFLFIILLVSFSQFLSAEPIVGGINIQGNFPIFEKELRRVIDIRIGDEFDMDAVNKVIKRIEKIYQDEGYDQVWIEHTLEDIDTGYTILMFNIHKGPKTRIREVSFIDDRPEEKPNIEFMLNLKSGLMFKRKKFKARLKAMEERLVRLGYLRADIRYLEKIQDNGVFLDIFIYRGPKLNIELRGNKLFTKEQIFDAVTFFENKFFDRLEVDESVEKIKALYQDNGLIDAQIDVTWSDPDVLGDRKVIFSIKEGNRTYLKDIIFEHNGYIKEKRLRRQFLSLRFFSFFRPRPYKAITFLKDLEALRALYQSEGFPNVRIITQTEGKDNRIVKKIIIDEGVRIIVRKISIEGNIAFSEKKLKKSLKISEGSPFRPKEHLDDKRRLAILYGNNGYPYARISVHVEKDENVGVVDIFYHIDEGLQAKFGKLIISRNLKTKEKVIRLATTFKQGSRFSYQKILDTQERLSNLGLFRSLSIEPKGMDEKAEAVDCLIEIEEMETGRINLGAGFSSRLGYRGYMEIREDNLWGRAISGSFRADLTGLGGRSQFIEEVGRSSKYTITFRDPLLIPRHKIEGEGSLYTYTEDRREYHIQSNGFQLALWRPYKRKLRIGLIYHIDLNRLDDVIIDPEDVPEKYEEHTISAIGPTIIYDSRDNFLDPHKGFYTNVSLSWAGDWIGGDQDFYKTRAEVRAFFPLTSRLVAAMSIRGGHIGVYGQSTQVPIQERFFAGGGDTVRGFKEDSLGPIDEDTGLPRGGRIFWINNLELRYPIFRSIKGVVFFDLGNVWNSKDEFDINSLRQGAGLGLRWITPIGPVRIDYGRAIDREPGEPVSRFYLSIGHAF